MAQRIRRTPGPRPDQTPDVPAAGSAVHVDVGNTTKTCFDWGHHAPYSKRSLLEPIQHMPGKVAPNVLAVSEKARPLTHGVRCDRSNTAQQVLSPPQINPLLAEREADREKIYHRKEHQVLGRSVVNDVTLPSSTQEPEFRFGMATKKGESVAGIMYPSPGKEDDAETHRKYLLSHRSYKPGERHMHYGANWRVPSHGDGGLMNRLNADGLRVRDALFWEEERSLELKNRLIKARLADFRERTRPELGRVHDPIKTTMEHLPPNHVFGITIPPDEFTIGDLLGYKQPAKPKSMDKDKTKWPPAGLQTHHYDDLDNQKHIVPKLEEIEDHSLPLKITEDLIGGSQPRSTKKLIASDLTHVFGVPSVRDPSGRTGQKKLADSTSYSDELGAKGLVYPTARNVYGIDQLRQFRKTLNEEYYKVAAA